MIGPEQTGAPLVAGVYLTRASGERLEYWRYFDGHHWSGGWWFGWQCREWFKGRTWPLHEKERETKRSVIYYKVYTQ
jgi:hypothetical protein